MLVYWSMKLCLGRRVSNLKQREFSIVWHLVDGSLVDGLRRGLVDQLAQDDAVLAAVVQISDFSVHGQVAFAVVVSG